MATIRKIEIKGYRSIKESSIELRPLNVLIGANGAGKSNFVSFFKLLNEMMGGRLQAYIGTTGHGSSALHFGPKVTPQLEGLVEFEEGEGTVLDTYHMRLFHALPFTKYDEMCEERSCEMGLGAGGQMEQDIYQDQFDLDEWDLASGSRVFVHLVNSLVWRAIAGRTPPTTPPTARQYASAGLPWFSYYDENATAVQGSSILQGVQSIADRGKDRGDVPLPENASCLPVNVVPVVKKVRRGEVREGSF